MGTDLTVRQKSATNRYPSVPGRLIDFTVLNSVAKLSEDDKRGNVRMMDEIQSRAAELAGPSPSALLQSIGFTVALCEHDVRARQALNTPSSDYEKRQRNLDRAMRRYLAAVKALAVVQRSGLPPIQVNIAEQQIVANG